MRAAHPKGAQSVVESEAGRCALQLGLERWTGAAAGRGRPGPGKQAGWCGPRGPRGHRWLDGRLCKPLPLASPPACSLAHWAAAPRPPQPTHSLALFETGSALLTVTCCRLPGWRSEVSRRSGSSPRSPPASSRVLESTLREQGGHLVQVRGPGREGEGSSISGTFSIACPCHYVFLQESLPLCRHRPGVWDRAGRGTARFGDLWMLP